MLVFEGQVGFYHAFSSYIHLDVYDYGLLILWQGSSHYVLCFNSGIAQSLGRHYRHEASFHVKYYCLQMTAGDRKMIFKPMNTYMKQSVGDMKELEAI